MRDSTVKTKGRTPARAYAIWAKEQATALNVIGGIFTLFDVTIIPTHSFICTTLATEKKLQVELTKFDVRVSKLLG